MNRKNGIKLIRPELTVQAWMISFLLFILAVAVRGFGLTEFSGFSFDAIQLLGQITVETVWVVVPAALTALGLLVLIERAEKSINDSFCLPAEPIARILPTSNKAAVAQPANFFRPPRQVL